MAYLFKTLEDAKGRVTKEAIANSVFARLRPGDYVAARYGYKDPDRDYAYYGCVFAKVISVKMPKYTLFQAYSGNVLVELPDGTRVDFLSESWPHYRPGVKITQYFEKFCFPSSREFRECDGSLKAYTAEHRAELKDDMDFEQARRRQIEWRMYKAERERQQAVLDARQRAAEEARRNAAVSDRELDNLFRGR